jgi:hypothetical protein
MRTSLRVFAAAVCTVMVAAFVTVIPFAPEAQAVNGLHTISVDNVTVSEANGSVTFHVTVQPTPNVPFDEIEADIKTVDDTARAGEDYTAFQRHVDWDTGDDATITVTVNNVITNDTGREPSERFTLSIINVVSASAGAPGSVTITDNEGGAVPTFVITGPGPSNEGNGPGNRVVTVKVNNPSTLPITINYATADGTATSDSEKGAKDYTPKSGTLTGLQDGNPQDITIPIIGDTLAEPDESFFVNFGGLNNAQFQDGQAAPQVVLINDDGAPSDVPKLTLQNIPDKVEGDTSTTPQTITVTLAPAAPQTVTVDYATTDGTATASTQAATGDYTETKGRLTFPQGTTSQTFSVPVVGDPADELDETYKVTLSAPANASITDPPAKDAKILNDDFGQITTVPGQSGGPHVRIFGATGSDLGGFFAVQKDSKGNDFTAGLHVARGDFFAATQDGFAVGSDGIDEIVVGAGAFPANSPSRSLPFVRILAVDGTQLASFFAFDQSFSGGVYVSAGNLDGDPSNGDELVVGAAAGGAPFVRVIRIKGGGDNIAFLANFDAYDPNFRGGVRVAVGDVTGDAKDELITATGPGGGPHVRMWQPGANNTIAPIGGGFFAYDPNFRGGVFVAAAKGRIATGPGAGGGPHVRLFDGNGLAVGPGFFAYDPNFGVGVSVALGNLDNDLSPEVMTGPGGGGGPHVKIFKQDGTMPFGPGFFAYNPNFHGGVEVAVSTGGL